MATDRANSYMKNKKIYTKSKSIDEYRYTMVKYALRESISAAAREFKTDRKTVRKWVTEYKNSLPEAKTYEDELKSLRNKTRIDQYHPQKLSSEDVERIIKLRGNSKLGAYFIKDRLGLKCSLKTIHKKLVQHGKVTKPETKSQRKRDMSQMRKAIKPFQKLQIDVKYLCDIPNILSDYLFGLIPKYQITVRDYKCGFTMVGYTYSKDSTSIGIFVYYVVYCLQQCGIDLSDTHFQSDNGSEFRIIAKKHGLSLYEEILTKFNIKYKFIPVARPTFNSDVESFHRTIERELYDIEKYGNLDLFMNKAWLYMIWYNCYRKNRNKNHKSPITIINEYFIEANQREKCKNINILVTFPPILVDSHVKDIELIKQGGELKWLSPTLFYIST